MSTLPHFATPQLQLLHRGKVRDSYRIDDSTRLIVVSDRLSAFDSVLETAIPHKGAVLNGLANFWFEKTAHIIPNHVKAMVDANAMLVKEAQPIKVEMVVRNYLTGSMLRGYQSGQRTFSGVTVPDGLTKHQQFPTPIVTPTTKEESDREITPANLVSEGWVSQELYDKMAEKALELFKVGSDLLASQGIILVDTKYEFGLLNGELILIDEIHTPDSSRFWSAADYAQNPEGAEQMDKEYIRQWLIANKKDGAYPRALIPEVTQEAVNRYLDIYQRIVGQPLATADETATGGNVANRLVSNLVKVGLMKDAWVSIVVGSPADEAQGEKIRSLLEGYEVFTQLENYAEVGPMTEVWNRSIEPGVIVAVADLGNGLGDTLAASVNVPVISCPSQATTSDSLVIKPSNTPNLTVASLDNAAQAALRALNTPRLRERLRQEILATKAN
ncbi:MAG: phosphoribosylaminoimidazolesuccinocarboxamide synthase [Janthinobacterium lividum]